MEKSHQSSSSTTGRRSSGPQGTQLFSADELNKLALESASFSDGRASANEPVLEGMQGALQGRRFSLRAGRQTLGRRDDNDIVINDLSVSSAHAWIMNQQGHYVVMNTLSTNGTFVNNKRVHEATIRHGDLIRFGQVEFVFLTREPGASKRARLTWSAVLAAAVAGLSALAWWWLKA